MRGAHLTPNRLQQRLQAPLPGAVAQNTMRSLSRPARYDSIPVECCRRGAVLILLVPGEQDNELTFPVIERADDGGPHSGQIALPGGGREHGDRTIADTALREAREEIGIPPDRCRVLGPLTPLHIDVSGFLVTPVVAWYTRSVNDDAKPLAYVPDGHEVKRVIPVSLGQFPPPRRVEELSVRGHRVLAPVFNVAGVKIWGATAMILAEFAAVLGKADLPAVQDNSSGNT